MTTPRALRLFFEVELRNEEAMRRDGDDPPHATLATAVDSLRQAPTDVIVGWLGASDRDQLVGPLIDLAQLIVEHGPDARLDSLV